MSLLNGEELEQRYRPFFENKAIQGMPALRITPTQSMKKPSSSLFGTLKRPMPGICARPLVGLKS